MAVMRKILKYYFMLFRCANQENFDKVLKIFSIFRCIVNALKFKINKVSDNEKIVFCRHLFFVFESRFVHNLSVMLF